MLCGLVLLAGLGPAAIVAKPAEYRSAGVPLVGYVAYNGSKPGKLPVVLVFHDWDGVNSYEQMRCRQLASLGYLAFAPDIYGRGAKTQTVPDRMKLVDKYEGDVA